MEQNEIKERIINQLKEKGDMAQAELQIRTGISHYTLKDTIPILISENILEIIEKGKRKHIHLKEVKND